MATRTHQLKIMTILGTRPEIIRLSRILPKLDQYTNHVVVYTGQSYDYELSDIFFQELELRKPDYVFSVKAETVGGLIANILRDSEKAILKEKPDAVLILGDTNSALSSIIAKRHGIPVFHMEAGNRSFDDHVPEELNRRIVDHISDINLAYTEHSRRYLLREGIHPGTIVVTGSPLAEVFDYFKEKIDHSTILDSLRVQPNGYFLVSAHREENVDSETKLKELFSAISALASQYGIPVHVSLHPRTKKRLETYEIPVPDSIKIHKPFGYLDYNKLQMHARCVLSDSGTIQEESAILGFPAVQIRVSTERPEAFDTGSIILSGFHHDAVLNAVNITLDEADSGVRQVQPSDYRDKNVSSKVVKLITGLSGIRKHHDFRIQPV